MEVMQGVIERLVLEENFFLFIFIVETRKDMVSRIILARLNETNRLDDLQFLEEIKSDDQQVEDSTLQCLFNISYKNHI